MKYKSWLYIFICLLLIFQLSSCSFSEMQGKKEIAVIVKSENSEFWKTVKKGVDAAATEYNVSVTFEGPANEEDYMTQNKMIESAINNKVDAIVISAIDYNRCEDAINSAIQKGVKIVTIDSTVNSKSKNVFIGTDNFSAGEMAAKAVVNNFKNNEEIYIGIINCNQATENGQQREEGFKSYINNINNAHITKIVNINSSAESSTVSALNILKDYPEINVLVGLNEFMTLGIGSAIEQLGLSDKVHAVGFDSNTVSIRMLESGEMDALIVQNPFSIGYLGIQYATKIIEGKSTDTNIYTQTSLITNKNMFDEENQKLLFGFE